MNEKKQQGNYGAQIPAKWRLLSKRKKTQHAFKMLLAATMLTSMHASAQWTYTGSSCAGTLTKLNTTHYLGTTGSYRNDGTDDRGKAFDGDINTYFDGPSNVTSGAWTGFDMGSPKRISCITFRPRLGWGNRMNSGKFQVASDSVFTNPYTLFTLPAYGGVTNFEDYYAQNFTTPTEARYFRYLSADNTYCNVAEITVYGTNPPPPPTAPSTDWQAYENTVGDKLVGKSSASIGVSVDTMGELLADSNIIAKNIYCHSFNYQYDEVIPDYVFDTDYSLLPLNEVEAYVKKHKHLPDVPSDLEYKEKGTIDVGEIDLLLLRKVEELTLHLIEQDKRIKALQTKNSVLRNRIEGKK